MENIFLHLVNMSITAGWIALAVIILRLFLKKAPKWITVLLWGLVGLRLILPISIESRLSLIPDFSPINSGIIETIPDTNESLNSQNNSISITPEENEFEGQQNIHNNTENILTPPVTENTAKATKPDLITIFSYIWLGGTAGMFIYSGISYLKIRKKVAVSFPIENNIRICDNINTPFILGVIKPKVYLPSDLSGSDAEYVISHEKAHIKRKDHLIKPLGFLLLSVYWFNPLLWIAYVLLCRDIELACDEKVIKDMGVESRKEYSTALLNCSVPRRMISACPLAFGEVSVKQRIKSVLNYKKPAFWISIVAIILCIALSVGFLTNPVDSDKENTESTTSTNTNSSALANFSDSFTPENLSATFTAKELIYTPSIYNYVQHPKDAPKYSLISGKRLLETKNKKITELGVMTPIVLDEEHFDSRFLSNAPLSTLTEDGKISTVPQTESEDVRSSLDIWTEPYALEKIKADNRCAMEVETETYFYQLLQQKNSQFLLVVGHKSDSPLTPEVNISYTIRWIYTLTKNEYSVDTLSDVIEYSSLTPIDLTDRITKVTMHNNHRFIYADNMYKNSAFELKEVFNKIKVKAITEEEAKTNNKTYLSFSIRNKSTFSLIINIYENDIIYAGNGEVSSTQSYSYYKSEGAYKTLCDYFENLKKETDKMYTLDYKNSAYNCVIKATDGTIIEETNSSRQPSIELVDKDLLFKWEYDSSGTLTPTGRFYNLTTKEISESFVGNTDYYKGMVLTADESQITLCNLSDPDNTYVYTDFITEATNEGERIYNLTVTFINNGNQIGVSYLVYSEETKDYELRTNTLDVTLNTNP